MHGQLHVCHSPQVPGDNSPSMSSIHMYAVSYHWTGLLDSPKTATKCLCRADAKHQYFKTLVAYMCMYVCVCVTKVGRSGAD